MHQLLEGSCSLGLAGWLFLGHGTDTPTQDNTGAALEVGGCRQRVYGWHRGVAPGEGFPGSCSLPIP